MADVFISYARSTAAIADRVANAVRAAGYSVWRDDELPAHRPYAEVIEERLTAAKAVIVLWSADAAKSQWVQAEAERARIGSKLVQLRVDDTALPMPFDRIECADFRGWNAQPQAPGLAKVLRSVAELVSPSDPMSVGAPAEPLKTARRVWPRTWLATGALIVAVLIAGSYALWTTRPSDKPVSTSLKLTTFAPVGPDVPSFVPAALDQALRDAFGRDNAVVIKDKDVDYVLRGTVERIVDKLHYSIRLEAVGDGAALWTTTVDRPSDNPVAVRRVAREAAWVVRCGLSRAAEYPRRLPVHALSLYLTYCDTGGSPATLQHAVDLAKAVIAEAPSFSRGWSGLAVSEALIAWSAPASEAAVLRAQGAKDSAQALRLDRRNAEAYMAQAFLAGDGRLVEQDAAFRRALAARPSDCGCEEESFGRFLAATGRLAEANRQTERALDLLPQAPGTLSQMFEGYLRVRNTVRADEILVRIANQFLPDDPAPLALRHVRALWTGDWPEAARTISSHTSPDVRAGLQIAYASLASRDPAQMASAAARLQRMISAADGDPELTEVLAALGDRDAALSALEAEVGHNNGSPPASLFDPPMAALRDEPRFLKVLQTSGLASYWRATHSRPDMCLPPSPLQMCSATN